MFGAICITTILFLAAVFIVWKFFLWQPKKNIKFLETTEVKKVTLSEKKIITHDTIMLIFTLPDPLMTLGIQVGQHIRV